MSLDPQLLEVRACPQDHGPLTYLEDKNVLVNPRLKIAYLIVDDIPVMLIDEATPYSPED